MSSHHTVKQLPVDPQNEPAQKATAFGYNDTKEEHRNYSCAVEGDPLPQCLEKAVYYKQAGAAFNSTKDTAQLDGLTGIVAFRFVGSDSAAGGRDVKALFSNAVLDQQSSRIFFASHGRRRKWVGTMANDEASNDTVLDKLGDMADAAKRKASALFGTSAAAAHDFYTGVNPNVVVWRLFDEKAQQMYPAAATEADGAVLRFDPITLDTLGSVAAMPQPATVAPPSSSSSCSSPVASDRKSAFSTVITTPAHFYESTSGTQSASSSSSSSSSSSAVIAATAANSPGGYHIATELDILQALPPIVRFSYGIYRGRSAPFQLVHRRLVASFVWGKQGTVGWEDRPSYMHSYAQTANYVIFFLSTMRLNLERTLAKDFSRGFFGLFDRSPLPLQLLIFKINHSNIKTKATADELSLVGTFSERKKTGLHLWHVSNAYEDDSGGIVLVSSAATDLSAQQSFLVHIRVDLAAGDFVLKQLRGENGSFNLEFPQINPHFIARPYRYTYALQDGDGGVVKMDVVANKAVAVAYGGTGKTLMFSEPLFVPFSQTAEEEDDGVVLVTVTNTTDGKSFLAVLDGRTMAEKSKVLAPTTINAGLHSHLFRYDAFIPARI